MASSETKVFGSVHEDPNFAVICSFISRYGTLLGLPDISFDALEKWIEDQRYMNDSVKDLLLKLLKRWKSSVNEDRLHQYLIKFCHSYSQVDAFEVESCGFQRCKTATKLRIIKSLMEQQFDSNTKFKEKINEVPACDLRCLPIGRDMTGKAYWFLADKEMNIRIYREEQDDVQNETWHIVVSDRSQLANLITTLEELKGKLDEKSRSATPSTVMSESNKSEADCCQLFSIPATSESSPHATDDMAKIEANGLAKPDFLLSSVKDEPPESVDPLTDAPPGAEHEKPNLKEEKEEMVVIKTLPNDTKTSVDVKLEAEENTEIASSVKAKNEDMSDVPRVAEDETDAKEEDESKEAESLIISSTSPRNEKQDDGDAEKSTETFEASSSETACGSEEIASSCVEVVSTVENSLLDLTDGKFSTVAASQMACEKDPECPMKSDTSDSSLTERKTRDDVAVETAIGEDANDSSLTERKTIDDVAVETAIDGDANDSNLTEQKKIDDVAVETTIDQDANDSNLTEQKKIGNVVVEPAVAEEMDKRADPSSSSSDSKLSTCAPIDLTGANREQIQKAESGDRAEKTSPDAKARVSVKRKRCEPVQRLSSTEADSARSESDLSESASESKMRLSGEEPPSKRKRDKALRTVAERDRRSGRVKGQTRSQTPDSNKKKGLDDEKTSVSVENRDESRSEGNSVEQSAPKENSNAGEISDSDRNETKLSANTHEILEIKCPDGGELTPRAEQLEAQQIKLDDDAKVLSTATNDEAILPETETTDAGIKPEGDQNKRPAGRTGRKGRKHGRSSRRKGRREEKENAAEKKTDTKTGTTERGRKKRGLKPSTNQEGEVDYEPNNKLVCPETTDERKNGSKGSTCVSEDDVPLIELRRSARANKGQRKFEPLNVPEPKKRRKNAELQEEKNRKKAELEEKRLRKEAELAALAAKNKKKRRGKTESDDDFVPGKGSARKAKGRSRGRKRGGAGGGGGSDEESEELEEELFEPESEVESLHFSASSSEEELESDGSVYEPKGRNAKRAAALKENAKPEVEVHDQLCSKCGRSDQPEWLLLCDHCEAAYHTACLRPPLLAIPEGDWFCPPCEHASLIVKLQEQLMEYDKKAKQNIRLIQRKERLAFVGISLSNILPVQQERRPLSKFPDLSDDEEGATEREEETEDEAEDTEEEEEEEDRLARSRNARRAQHHQTKQNRDYQRRRKQRQRSPSERSFSEEATEDEEEEDEEGWSLGRRSRRQRKEISYKFEEFDELINEAIEDDVKDAKGAGNFGRGKDMSNITGIRDSDNDDHGPHGKRKKRRHLTKLDSNDEEPDDDDSEEYQISQDEASSASAEEEEDTIDADEESDDWQVSRQPTWGQIKSKKGSRHSKRGHKRSSAYDKDFVVDEYNSEDDRPWHRRRRAATQRRINYQEDSDETDASQSSRPPARKKPARRSGIYSSGSENGNSGTEKKQRRKTRVKSDDSEYVPSADEDCPGRHGSSSTATKKTGNHKRIGSDTDEYSGGDTVSRKKGRMNNYIIESTEEDEEEEEEEVENSTTHKDDQPGDGNGTEGSPSDAESRTSEEVGLSEQNEPSAKDSDVLSLQSKPETAKMLNGHYSASSVNGNTESHNNHNFSIANLLKNSDKRPAALPRVAEFEALDLFQGSREDSLNDVLDLVDYVTQGDPA